MTQPKKPSYTLEFTPAAIRELEKLDPNIRRKVFSDIEKLNRLLKFSKRVTSGMFSSSYWYARRRPSAG
jgi:mRNA-degrading endonuclease RelE of RelBE toxin-antitoxin system